MTQSDKISQTGFARPRAQRLLFAFLVLACLWLLVFWCLSLPEASHVAPILAASL